MCAAAAKHITHIASIGAIIAVTPIPRGACVVACHWVWDGPMPSTEGLPMPRQPIELIPIPGQPGAYWGPNQAPSDVEGLRGSPVAEPSGMALLLVMVAALFAVRCRVR